MPSKPERWQVEIDAAEHQPPDFSSVYVTLGEPSGEAVAHVDPFNANPAEAEARGHLIAAAPALRDALRRMVDPERFPDFKANLSAARAALALADGEGR